ncbi:hypothetical protein P7C70_g2520, partial [Phenoliferia sp. Uapishka_3]
MSLMPELPKDSTRVYYNVGGFIQSRPILTGEDAKATFSAIPVIDFKCINGSPGEREELAAEVGKAARDVGFFVARNTPVGTEIMDDAFKVIHRFFSLPESYAQMKLHTDRSPAAKGYTPVLGTTAYNIRESFGIGNDYTEREQQHVQVAPAGSVSLNQWPEGHPEFRKTLYKYYHEVYAFAKELVQIFALALGLSETALISMFGAPLTDITIQHYPAIPDVVEETEVLFPHADYSVFTILLQNKNGSRPSTCSSFPPTLLNMSITEKEATPPSSPSSEKGGDQPAEPSHFDTQAGVLKVVSAQRVWGPKSKICLWAGVALVAYVYSLDGTTTYQYQAYATSSFDSHSLLGAIVTAQAIVLAVMKPIAAKFSDTLGRAETYALATLFYVLGYIVLASCSTVNTYAGGAILYEVGYASVQILQQLVIGDVTSLRWRSLLSSTVSLPFFINAFVSANIAEQVIDRTGWRWGYGMFAIIMPAAIAPIVVTLFWAQYRAKKLGVQATNYLDQDDVARTAESEHAFFARMWHHLVDLDAFGLLLFAAGWSCLLLPLTLVNNDHTTWKSHSIIAMLVVGGVILIAFIPFEAKVAPKPLFPLRFFQNPTILFSALIGFFDFVSFCASVPPSHKRVQLTIFPKQTFNIIAAAIWRQKMPEHLASHLSGLLNSTEIASIYGSITTATSYPLDGPIYAGIIDSYDATMKTLLIAATCIAVIPITLSFFVQDMFLSDAHNDVEGENVKGEMIEEAGESVENKDKKEKREDGVGA